jgi:F-type H+-transporting ATPase subunit delta
MQAAVARRYAEALFAVAQQQGKVELLDAQAKTLIPVWRDQSVRRFFIAPQIPAAKKKAAAEARLGGRIEPLLINLIKVLIDHNRVGALVEVLEHFDLLTDRLRGVEEVTIVTAVPLSDPQKEAITAQLLRFSAYGELRVGTQVDPDVLGGVLVRLGRNQVLDGTLASRLGALKDSLN